MKLLGFCRTTTKKSNLDLLNFYVISAGHDMVNHGGRLPSADAISKPHDYKQNVQEMKGLLKKWALTGNCLKISNQKIQSPYGEQNKRTTRTLEQKLNMNHVARKKLNQVKLIKAFRIKLFELLKTSTKKSNPDLLNFYVISAGRDMVNDAGMLPQAGAISKPHDYKQNV